LLAEVYMAMTRGQESLMMDLGQSQPVLAQQTASTAARVLRVMDATEEELAEHAEYLKSLSKAGAKAW
jgi:DNA polymerase III subunit epsilon